jgi:hypothetical protein
MTYVKGLHDFEETKERVAKYPLWEQQEARIIIMNAVARFKMMLGNMDEEGEQV